MPFRFKLNNRHLRQTMSIALETSRNTLQENKSLPDCLNVAIAKGIHSTWS